MAICIISNLLAFAAGFGVCLLCALRCSDESWEKLKKVIDESRASEED